MSYQFNKDRAQFEQREASSPEAAMQRVIVRMLFDPAFVARVYEAPKAALGALKLPPRLVSQLVANDRRVWSADALRAQRALKALMEEFKVTTTLLLLATGKVRCLEDFFSSDEFHSSVQHRGYMALAFGSYLERLLVGLTPEPAVAGALAVLNVEGGMVRARRRLREARRAGKKFFGMASAAPSSAAWVMAPGSLAVVAPGGTVTLIQHVEKWLFEAALVPALALCDDGPSPAPLPSLDHDVSKREAWLLEAQAEGKVDLSGTEVRFAQVMQRFERPCTRDAFGARATAAQLHPERLWPLAEALIEAEVLVPVPEHNAER